MRHILMTLVLTALVTAGGATAGDRERGTGDESAKKSPIEVKIEHLPKMRVACVRHIGPYENTGPIWEKLTAWAHKEKALDKNTVFLGLYYDYSGFTPPDMLRCDACMTVDEKVKTEGDVKIKEAGGKEYALATHVGPYKNLKNTYELLFSKGLPRLNRAYSTGPVIEIYKNDPKSTPPDKLVTEIYVPLKP